MARRARDRFARALAGTLTDPALAALPPVGAVDQWADGLELLERQRPPRAAVEAFGPVNRPAAGRPSRG
ncbi:hypothetical protein D7319_13935 [Streptomyces radicis]|uniref:Uncharacterized protein n=1 Tax=Streptomyces radicis TaxID=1750517 RepID=A0A3A9W7B2_9ACTN|nr:hypothetical protein D7319_13935 [Streptomyces radicis]RKN22781.1 hypothetical protein D7318_14620 [Streptomyces radicis]